MIIANLPLEAVQERIRGMADREGTEKIDGNLLISENFQDDMLHFVQSLPEITAPAPFRLCCFPADEFTIRSYHYLPLIVDLVHLVYWVRFVYLQGEKVSLITVFSIDLPPRILTHRDLIDYPLIFKRRPTHIGVH